MKQSIPFYLCVRFQIAEVSLFKKYFPLLLFLNYYFFKVLTQVYVSTDFREGGMERGREKEKH